MTAFVKSDLRQTVDFGASFNQYLFDILSKLVDKSNDQVGVQKGGGVLCKYLILEGEEVERLRTMMHEQGRDIDQLKQASSSGILSHNTLLQLSAGK